ncbi:MAG: DUF6519 domain-containing protein, partial [Cyanobacteriota bacterium]|nr:DUF6519 domain-containing protein [Cyanobacteriota bacterium]
MKGDFTRFTFKPRKHYTSVLMQQGRVQLDADWNEQANIHAHFNQSIAQDMIGASGAVKDEVQGVESRDSFQIIPTPIERVGREESNSTPADADLIIAPGHFYVDGILCELESGTPFIATEKSNNQFEVKSLIVDNRPLEVGQWVEVLNEDNQPIDKQLQIKDVITKEKLLIFKSNIDDNIKINKLRRVITYKTQPDYPQALQTDIELKSEKEPPKTYYLAYLDVWQRHITAIEDTNIREVALNGNDTTTRTQTVWQVKLYKIADLTKKQINRESAIKKWRLDSKINHSPVYLTKIKESKQNWDNQLYRVEIHQPGKLGIATFKWSKNNGSTVFPIKEIVGNQISLNNPNRDASQSFSEDQLVEITDDVRELQGKPGTLVQLKDAVRDKLTFDPTTVEGKSINSNNFPQKYNPKVRAWDGITKNATVSIDGIEINFSAESEKDGDIVYRTGDYWLIPIRKEKVNDSNLIGDFGTFLPQTPTGVEHHYSPLALLYYDGDKFNLEEDLRSTFAPLSRVLDKAGGIITGKLEIQDNLYITGKNISNQDNTDTKFIPGKVRIGTEISPEGKHLRGEPDARLHLQGTPPTSLSVESSENGTIKVSTDSEEKLKVGDTITITPLNAGNPLTSIVTEAQKDNSSANKQSLKVFPEFTVIPTSKFSYQQPIMLLADYENNPKIIVNSQGNLGIGTNIPHQKLVVNNEGKVGIGYNDINQKAALAIKGNVGIGTQNPDPTAKLEVNGDIKITGERLKNADNWGIVDTKSQDWLNINPDSDYPGIRLFNPVAISSGLAIGELIKIPEGELKVNKNAFLAATSGKVSIGTPQQKRDNTLLEIAGSTIIGSFYIDSKTAPENGLLVEGKINIGDTPDDNQQAKASQLYSKGDAYIDGEIYATDINITGSRIKSADLLGIIETNAKDWLRVNPDSAYPGIALYNPVAISKGGLAIVADEELIKLAEGQLQVSNSAFLATTSGKVSIGTPQQKRDNTLLEVAGSTIIGSSYIDSKTVSTNGLLVEGQVNIGDTPGDNQQATAAQLYTKGDAYIDGKLYTKDLTVTGDLDIGELTQLSLSELKV